MMINLLLLGWVCWIGVSEITRDTDSDSNMKVMSYNIRYNNPNDGVNAWMNRKDRVAETILKYQPAVIGMQEVLKDQLDDLEHSLEEYSWVGKGRDDGKNKGEFSPIFYKNTILNLKDWNVFWLSETPGKPSKDWDAALPRICTWAKFEVIENGTILYVFNTHFDHKGETARIKSAELIKERGTDVVSEGFPTIIMGDFNFEPDSEGYLNLTSFFADSYHLDKNRKGPAGTFSGFEVKEPEPQRRIDYIFTSKDLDINSHRTISDSFEGYYPSDHLPVLCEISF